MSDTTEKAGDSPVPLPAPLDSARDQPWPFVGRESELEEIAGAWSRVVAGGLETVLVAGEPGAGKSRLVADAAATVCGGGLALYGSGEVAAETPYGPFAAALRELGGRAPGLLGEARRSSLGQLLLDAPPGEGLPLSLDEDRGKLFAAATALFEQLGAERPVLLAIDDLHACGASTLALIDHLARSATPLRLLLLLTYRPTEVEPGGEQATAIADLRSAPAARHLRLAALNASALRGVAAALAVSEQSAELDRVAEEVERESGGNALFACELLRAMAEGGPGGEAAQPSAPPSLRMLIATRARALGQDASECLEAAAVCGREFDPALVAAVLDAAPAEVSASLGRGARAGFLSAGRDGRAWAFGHAIVARCLYEELDVARRGALHRRAAVALEAGLAGEPLAGELARHWRLAEPPDRDRAATWAEAAGRLALRGYDHELAAGWLEAALALRGEDAEGAPQGIERCDLLTGLGIALRYTDQERSRECLLEAARLADRLGEVDRLVAAALANHRGFVSQVGGFDRERAAMLRRAGEQLGGSGPGSALVLAQLALEMTFTDQVERRRWLAESALLAARRSGERDILAQVLVRCAIALWDPDNAAERIAMAAESIAIGAELDEPLELFHALHWQAVAHLEVCEVEAAARSLREQERIAARTGDTTARWLCEYTESLHLSLHGRLEEAEAYAQRAVERARRSGQPDSLPPYISQLCSIRWHEGRIGELAPLLAQALRQFPGLPGFRSLVTLAHAEAGEADLAREVLTTDLATRFESLPRDPIWIATMVDYAYAVVRLGDREAAALLHRALDPYRGRLATTGAAVWGLVDHALGRLELLLGEEEAARRSLRAAANAYAAIGAPLWKALAEADLETTGGAKSALEARVAALGLTARQAEVTRLIAKGMSNREAAEQLHLSPSTVKRHLENVYRRTGVSSRSALAALLFE